MNCAIEPLLLPISGLERAYIKLINVRRSKSEFAPWLRRVSPPPSSESHTASALAAAKRKRKRKRKTSIIAYIVGFLSGFVMLAVYACCRAFDVASWAEERER